MNKSVEKFSEQSVVSRALALRAKMAVDDLYKQYICCTEEDENILSIRATDSTIWDDWTDWSNRP